jgi:RNA polymerase sigma-70 factor (ECF subfamily)
MLGSLADAEDVVQEAFIGWMQTDRTRVLEPEAFLRRAVTRLCLDVLKSARRRRETYVGPWLPEPLVEEEADEEVTLPLLLALERLSPLERAAFLLHDVFGVSFDEVAATIRRDVATCRQLASRARIHIREERPRFRVEKQHAFEVAETFFAASRSGDMTALQALLADDVSVVADGGGKRPAISRPLHGLQHVMTLHKGLAKTYALHRSVLVRVGFINGLPGFVTREADGELQSTALEIVDGTIKTIYIVRNPDKLRHLH